MNIQEKPLRYGEGGRGFAMVTLPEQRETAPIVVLLNAGLLHRAEPFRLNVLAARRLAAKGYISVRMDLSGKGDTPPREGLINRESVALDWKFLCEALDRQFGRRPTIILGLCSGADNGIKLSAVDLRIRGLILLDARSPQDRGFRARRLLSKALDAHRWAHLPAKLLQRLIGRTTAPGTPNLGLRDFPRADDLERCIKNLTEKDGRLLMVFTSQAVDHYNFEGQFVKAVATPGLEKICREHYWPDAEHIYPVQAHRDRLLDAIEAWATEHLDHFRTSSV